jgi:hypothetical protein
MRNIILMTTLIAGTLDIVAACLRAYVTSGITPNRILQYIASGVFGKAAYSGAYSMMALGLFFHYTIAFACVACLFWLYPKWSFLWHSIWLNALLIGVVAWFVTTQIVVRLSRISAAPLKLGDALIAMSILVVCIGVPTAYFAKRFFSQLMEF